MFNEILRDVAKFINGTDAYFEEPADITPISKYVSFCYDIPVTSIVKVGRIKLDMIPDIIIAALDCELPNRFADYIFYEGELVKVISWCTPLWEKSEANKVAMLLTLIGDINNAIIVGYDKYINTKMAANSFIDTLTYAPFILAMAYVQKHFPFIEDNVLELTFKLMYPKITHESIISARRLLEDFNVADLLDRGVWYGVSNEEYPDIRFFDLKDKVAKSVMPGKGVWNLSDMTDDMPDEYDEEESVNDDGIEVGENDDTI